MTREEMIKIKEERGYSFKKLSEYTGVPMVTLQKIFSGATAQPRKATLDAIERVLSADETRYQGKAYEYSTGASEDNNILKESAPSYYTEKKQGEYTLMDYYTLPDERWVELIDGVFYDMSSPLTVHQDIISIIHMAFFEYIRNKKKQCKVYESPVDVQLCCDERTLVQPDLVVVCDRDKIKRFGIYGAPDFVLEVLSQSTRKKDLTIKLNIYLEAGVREYWIIDPITEKLIVYNFMVDEFLPCIYPLTECVPVAISENELKIDLSLVSEVIEEFRLIPED